MNQKDLAKGVEAVRKRVTWWRTIQPHTRDMLRGIFGRQFDLLEMCVQVIDRQSNQLKDLRKIIADREALKVAEQQILGAIDAEEPEVPMLPVTEYQHINEKEKAGLKVPPGLRGPKTKRVSDLDHELKTPAGGVSRTDVIVDKIKEISQLLDLGDLDFD